MIVTVTLNTAVDKLYRVEALKPYTVMRVKQVSNTAGGKGLNVARVAALAGQDVTAMGFVGGYNGSLLESLVTEPHLTKAFSRVEASTRSCINVWDEATGCSTEFLEPGSSVTQAEADRFLKEYEAALPAADVVVLSGSLPKGLPENFYALLIQLAQRYEKPVLLDTSGTALQTTVAACPTLIKPNMDEIRELLQVDVTSRAQLIAAAKQLQQSGIPIVAVSLGKEGVLVVCQQGVYHGVTPDISVVNTVGCGDSMMAGFAVGIANGWSMEDVIHYAVSVSTANAMHPKTGYYEAADLEKVRPFVRVEMLEDAKLL